MGLVPTKNSGSEVMSLQERAADALIEEKRSHTARRNHLTYFFMGRDVVCLLYLLIMVALFAAGKVTLPILFISQVVNAICRGRGKGLNRIMESEFPKRE